MKTLVTAAVIALLPGLAFAEGCSSGHLQTSQCADGQFFDTVTKTCIDKTTS